MSSPTLSSVVEAYGGTSASPLREIPESTKKLNEVLDPITTLVQLTLIESEGTKVQIYDNRLFIQPPGLWQKVERTPVTSLFHRVTGFGTPPPSRDDYVVFPDLITKAAKWYKPHVNESVKQLFRLAIDGLNVLKATYAKTTTKHSFIICIQLIDQACEGTLKFTKKDSKAESSEPIDIAAPSPSSSSEPIASSSDAEIILRSKHLKNRFKNLWDLQQIEDVVKRIGIVKTFTNSTDLEEKVNADEERKLINGIVQKQVLRLKALEEYKKSFNFCRTMAPIRKTDSTSSLDS